MEILQQKKTYPFLQGGGEMGERTRSFDWSLTPVGHPDQWPQSLRITVSNLLRSKFPMFLWWGDDMIQFYNDAYRPSLGNNGKHPSALGEKGADCWPETWDIISPSHHQVQTTGEATWMENQLVPIYRNGRLEEVYWTYSYSSVLDDDGNHGGILVTCMETTDTVLGQKKIEQSQQELLVLFEESPVAIAKISKENDLTFEFANSFYGELVGRKPEEIVGKPLLEALPEIKGQGFDELLKQVIRTGEPFIASEVSVNILRGGQIETIYVDLTYQPRKESDGSIGGVLVVATDVTKQVWARKKIEESEGRFRLLADASPNLIWMLKSNGAYGYVNKTTLDFLGITQDQIAASGWEPFQHPADLELATEAITKAIQKQQPYELEHRLRHKSGEYRWVLSQAIPAFAANGAIFAYVGSSIDIHEAKRYRQELYTALEQMRLSKEAAELGTFDMDLEKGTMHWDDRCRTLFGISHHDTVSYEKDFVKGLHPDDRERITQVIDHLFIKSISDGDYDVEYRTVGAEDSVVRWVRAKGKVYFNEQEKPVRFIGSVLDITEKVTAIQKIEQLVEERTKELAQTNKELKRSNQNLEEFAHAASHDLKEPIRKIHFFTHQLKEQLSGHINEGEKRLFSRIEDASQRMGNLIDDLLLYSHVSQRPQEKDLVDLTDKVQQALMDLDLDMEEKGAVVNVGKLPIVAGYRRQLQQLFQNLLSNAIKYSKENVPPCINIRSNEVEHAGNRYHLISVADNGIGFAQEHEEKIFKMFSRLHARAEYSGTGVGLSIVKKIVENHEGYIKVKSEAGIGSTFEIYLPA